jgi:hypothetical protein
MENLWEKSGEKGKTVGSGFTYRDLLIGIHLQVSPKRK